MGYRWISVDDLEYEERPPKEGEEPRRAADLTTAVELKQSRARLWRYPPHSTGRRHQDHVQEEVFVVISGTLTMFLSMRKNAKSSLPSSARKANSETTTRPAERRVS